MKILCFGDSNTYGYDPHSYYGGRYSPENRWVDILAEKLNCELLNYGQNGLSIPDNEYAAEVYESIFIKEKADLIFIMLGSNDLLQGMTAKSIAARMGRFIQKLSYPVNKILLIVPPAFKSGLWVDNDIQLENSLKLGSEYARLADRLGMRYADAGTWGIDLAFDGVHFTAKGHKRFAEKLFDYICLEKERL